MMSELIALSSEFCGFLEGCTQTTVLREPPSLDKFFAPFEDDLF